MRVRRDIDRTNHHPPLARRPSSELRLSAAELELLKDPDWIDEDEADLILAIRDEKTHGLKGEKVREFARRHRPNVKG